MNTPHNQASNGDTSYVTVSEIQTHVRERGFQDNLCDLGHTVATIRLPLQGVPMGYRRFVDRDGRAWELRDVTRSEWELVPESGDTADRFRIPAPNYEADPFELSGEEVQRLVDKRPDNSRRKPPQSPFLD